MYYVYWIHRYPEDNPETDGYIGVTNNIHRRFKEHKGRKNESHLRSAIDCYGWDNLIKDVYCIVNSKEEAFAVEGCLRDRVNIGWNIVKGGVVVNSNNAGHKFGVGRVVSDDAKARISKALIGNKNGLGAKHSKEANEAKSKRVPKLKHNLSIDDLLTIDGMLKAGIIHKEIAKMYGVPRATITKINTRRCKYYREVLGV